MDDHQIILSFMSSPIWWISIILSGILINLLSSFLLKRIEKFLSKYFLWIRNRAEFHKEREDKLLKELKSDKFFQITFRLENIKSIIMGVSCLLIGLLGSISYQLIHISGFYQKIDLGFFEKIDKIIYIFLIITLCFMGITIIFRAEKKLSILRRITDEEK